MIPTDYTSLPLEIADLPMRLEVGDFPERRWVECASCIEGDPVGQGTDEAQSWAAEHLRRHPAHDRFRIVSMTAWRLAPGSAERKADES
ncbi:hypothetical protein [Streptomyces umbrinus]|uniref:DUF7848 domain-containing protein n=1 Tax=Streptomyces umbrinus TaxID=67370 RepID=UPI003414E778